MARLTTDSPAPPATPSNTLENSGLNGDLIAYKIDKQIGEGGMGAVYLARDSRLERQVAIKIIKLQQNSDDALKEARILARLNHANIVHLYDIVQKGDHIALIMEYVEGTSLNQFQLEQVSSLTQKLRWLVQISEGLAAAHGAGIIHCDLKAANILISHQNHAKIADFGISQTTTGQTEAGQSYGSHTAMSPEQLQQQPIDHRSDLFSLGMLAFELIASQHPFGGGSSAQIAKQIITATPMDAAFIAPPIPVILVQLLNQLLTKDPAQRPQSTAHVAERFKQILMHVSQQQNLAQQTVALDATTQPLSQIKWLKSKSKTKTLAGALSVVLLALVVILLNSDLTKRKDRQVVVLRPVFTAIDNVDSMQQSLVIATIDHALRQSVVDSQNMHLISHNEVAAIRGGVKMIGKATGATDIITTALDCNKTRCNVTFSRLGGDNWAVQSRQQWPTPLDSYTALYSTSGSYFATLYADEQSHSSLYKINEQDYLTYIRLYDQKASVEGLDQLKQVLIRSPYLFAAYRLFRKKSRDLYDQTQDRHFLSQVHQLVQNSPPEYRYSVFQSIGAFWLAISGNDLLEAKTQLDIAEKRGANPSTLLEMRAYLFRADNAFEQSIVHYKKALKLRPSTLLLYDLALSYWWMSNFDQTKATLIRLLEIDPNHDNAFQLLASVYLLEGDVNAAISAFEKIIKTDPQSIDLSNLSLAYALNGQYQQSLLLAQKAVKKSPGHPTWLLNLADAQMIQGQTEQAQANYQQVISLHQGKNKVKSWLEKSQAFVHIGAFEEALKALNMAKKLAPENGEVAFTAALVYAQLDEDISAVTQVEAALASDIGVVWFRLPWFERLCDSQKFIRLMSDAGNSLRCSR